MWLCVGQRYVVRQPSLPRTAVMITFISRGKRVGIAGAALISQRMFSPQDSAILPDRVAGEGRHCSIAGQ